MNERNTFYDIKSFYNKKAKLKASFQGMRYQVEQVNYNDEKKLKVTIWSEPFCFEKTPDEFKEIKEFDYNEAGLDNAYEWVYEKYESDIEKWTYAKEFPLNVAKNMKIIGDE